MRAALSLVLFAVSASLPVFAGWYGPPALPLTGGTITGQVTLDNSSMTITGAGMRVAWTGSFGYVVSSNTITALDDFILNGGTITSVSDGDILINPHGTGQIIFGGDKNSVTDSMVVFGTPTASGHEHAVLVNGTLHIRSTSTSAGHHLLHLEDSSGDTVMHIQEDGRVGINTTNPQSILSLAGTAGGGLAQGISFGDGDTGVHESADDNMRWTIADTDQIDFTAAWFRGIASQNFAIAHSGGDSDTSVTYTFVGDTNTGTGASGADQWHVVTGGVQAVLVDASQNVGLNTTSPAERLHVSSGNIVSDYGIKSTTLTVYGVTDLAGGINTHLTISGSSLTVEGKSRFEDDVDAVHEVNASHYSIAGSTFIHSNVNTTVGIGIGAGDVNTGGSNVFIGRDAGGANTSGAFNVCIGHLTCSTSVSIDSLNAIGQGAIQVATNTANTNAFGRGAGGLLQKGNDNTLFGHNAGNGVLSGTSYENTTAIGSFAGYNNSSGDNNTFIGRYAGIANTTGDRSIYIGAQAGESNTTGSDNIIIGYNIDGPAATTSNHLNIGGLLYGTIGSALVGINQAAPQAGLHISSAAVVLDGSGIKLQAGGPAPTVSSCGTSPSITGNDLAGKVTIGSSASSTCTLTFATEFTAAPACSVVNGTVDVPPFATTSTTALTITDGAGDFSSDVIMYICIGL